MFIKKQKHANHGSTFIIPFGAAVHFYAAGADDDCLKRM